LRPNFKRLFRFALIFKSAKSPSLNPTTNLRTAIKPGVVEGTCPWKERQ